MDIERGRKRGSRGRVNIERVDIERVGIGCDSNWMTQKVISVKY